MPATSPPPRAPRAVGEDGFADALAVEMKGHDGGPETGDADIEDALATGDPTAESSTETALADIHLAGFGDALLVSDPAEPLQVRPDTAPPSPPTAGPARIAPFSPDLWPVEAPRAVEGLTSRPAPPGAVVGPTLPTDAADGAAALPPKDLVAQRTPISRASLTLSDDGALPFVPKDVGVRRQRPDDLLAVTPIQPPGTKAETGALDPRLGLPLARSAVAEAPGRTGLPDGPMLAASKMSVDTPPPKLAPASHHKINSPDLAPPRPTDVAPTTPAPPMSAPLVDVSTTPVAIAVDSSPVASIEASAGRPLNLPLRDLPQVLTQLAAPITRSDIQAGTERLANGALRTELELAPAELGRLRLVMQTGERGLQMIITVERPETMDLVRRHIDGLQRGLLGDGVALDRIDLGTGGAGWDRRGDRTDGPPPPENDAMAETGAAPTPTPSSTEAVRPGRLDIRL
ncbi:flagellar hook-length control protein FliK [uncultured Jannaschia sp.]|uniref:flagellar hook-length control protein FliK n=1 Tax=uncultured Jannaschia sp. TaxID=293347 RepID=UPI00261F6518|nr:flagellar hook-length control protein FliK [uncultured Jannaschia sp.]